MRPDNEGRFVSDYITQKATDNILIAAGGLEDAMGVRSADNETDLCLRASHHMRCDTAAVLAIFNNYSSSPNGL